MAFNLTLCPFCGRDLSADEMNCFVCESCGRRVYRARSALTGFLAGKPYENEYEEIIEEAEHNPQRALDSLKEIFDGKEEPDTDLYFTRAIVHSLSGEEGKARSDWKKGLECIRDDRVVDAYIVSACRCITESIIIKERDFVEFDYIQFIDDVANDFAQAVGISCKGIFFITVYRNLKVKYLAGELSEDDDLYRNTVVSLCSKIVPYGRNLKTVISIISDVLQDLEYNPETYEDDDNLVLHIYEIAGLYLSGYTENFSDDHILSIFEHWNDDNMSQLDYLYGHIVASASDSNILAGLSQLFSKEEIDIGSAVEEYVQKYLLMEPKETESSENAEM